MTIDESRVWALPSWWTAAVTGLNLSAAITHLDTLDTVVDLRHLLE
jgi:hypothetical protein